MNLGTFIEIENSVVKKQEPVAMPLGTNICMKNLFFNVPARRNFLKSNAAEMRHIVDEFIRVALLFPKYFFPLPATGNRFFTWKPAILNNGLFRYSEISIQFQTGNV